MVGVSGVVRLSLFETGIALLKSTALTSFVSVLVSYVSFQC